MSAQEPLKVNGWTLYAHPLFLEQLKALTRQVESLRQKDSGTYKKKNATKRLAAIIKLALEVIPQDPTSSGYRQGTTLGKEHKHWFRAKFFQQYRLFFRYHLKSKIIVYVWVNDDATKRAYNSKTDAYRVFQNMLNSGHPPDNWDELLKQVRNQNKRLYDLGANEQ